MSVFAAVLVSFVAGAVLSLVSAVLAILHLLRKTDDKFDLARQRLLERNEQYKKDLKDGVTTYEPPPLDAQINVPLEELQQEYAVATATSSAASSEEKERQEADSDAPAAAARRRHWRRPEHHMRSKNRHGLASSSGSSASSSPTESNAVIEGKVCMQLAGKLKTRKDYQCCVKGATLCFRACDADKQSEWKEVSVEGCTVRVLDNIDVDKEIKHELAEPRSQPLPPRPSQQQQGEDGTSTSPPSLSSKPIYAREMMQKLKKPLRRNSTPSIKRALEVMNPNQKLLTTPSVDYIYLLFEQETELQKWYYALLTVCSNPDLIVIEGDSDGQSSDEPSESQVPSKKSEERTSMRSLIKNFRSNSEDWMNKGRREGGGSGKRDIGYIHGWLKLQKEDQKKSIIRKFCVLQDFILLQYPSEKTHETSAISIDLRGCVVVLQNEIVPAKWKRNVYAMKLKHNRREIVKDADYIIIYTASLEEQELWKRAIENASQWDAKKEKDKEKDKEKEKELAEDQENENDLPTNTSTTATTTAETKTKAGDDSNDDDEDSNNSFVDDDDDDITIESKREDYWHAESHGLRIETVHWLNSILLRFFQNIRHSEELVDGVKNSLETRLTTKLAQRNLDTYIAEFKVLQLDLGDGCPSITGVKIIPQPMPGEIGMDIQLDYNGNAKIALSATIHVNLRGHTYTSIPVVADATLRSLSGKLHLHCAPWPAERFSLSFYREPKMNIQLDTTMGENKQVKNFPKLGDLLLKKLKNTLIEKMVMPNRRYIRIPKSGGRKKRQATTANTNKPAATPTEAKNIPFPGVPLHKAPSAPSSSSASSATSASSSVAAAAASSSSSSCASSAASSAAPSAPSSPSKEDKSVPFPGVPLRNTPPIPSSPPSSSSPAVPSPSPASSSAETTAIPVLPIAPSAAPTATSGTSGSVASVQNPKPQEATTLPTTIATTQATAELPENIAKETLTTSSSADKCNVQENAGTSKQANEAEGKKEKIDITASDGSSGNVAIPKHKRLSFSVKKKLLMPATTTTETDLIPESKHKQAPLPLPGRGQTTSASTKAASAIVDRNNPTQRKAVLSTWLESEASYVERMKPLIQFFSEQSCMDLAELHDMISEVMIIVNYHQKLYSDLRSRLTDAEGHLKGKDKVKKAASRIMIAQQHAAVSGDGKEQVEKMKEKAEEEYLFVYVGDLSLELADFAEIEMDHIGKVKHYLATLKILRKKNFSFHQVLMQRVSEGLPALEDMLQIPLSHMRLYSTIFEGLIHYTSVESELIVLQYAANKLKERTATIQQHKISEKVSETRHRAKRWLHDKLHKNEEGSSDGALT